MTKEEIKTKAKDLTVKYFDTYCGTGFVLCSEGFLKEVSKESADYNTMSSIIEGIIDGILYSEECYKDIEYGRNSLDRLKEFYFNKKDGINSLEEFYDNNN